MFSPRPCSSNWPTLQEVSRRKEAVESTVACIAEKALTTRRITQKWVAVDIVEEARHQLLDFKSSRQAAVRERVGSVHAVNVERLIDGGQRGVVAGRQDEIP